MEMKKNYFTSKNQITSIAIGGFDGMHLAHQKLFSMLDSNGAVVVIETGYATLSPGIYRENYTSLPIFYYDLIDIKHLEGKQFINLLKEEYKNLKTIVVGYDFHFGANAKYNTNDLVNFFDHEVLIAKEVKHKGIGVHSKLIRSYLKNGNIQQANTFLNKPYKITGKVIKGQGLGKKLIIPTINLNITKFVLPKDGVYATKTTINEIIYNSITFIGNRVSTDGKFSVETHIIDKTINIKSNTIDIEFYRQIRINKKFENIENLKKHIHYDIQEVKKYFDN